MPNNVARLQRKTVSGDDLCRVARRKYATTAASRSAPHQVDALVACERVVIAIAMDNAIVIVSANMPPVAASTPLACPKVSAKVIAGRITFCIVAST